MCESEEGISEEGQEERSRAEDTWIEYGLKQAME